jgi:hypothetical protein
MPKPNCFYLLKQITPQLSVLVVQVDRIPFLQMAQLV